MIKEFANTYEFCVGNINEICLMLRKSANLYEYMDSSKIFDETSLPEKEEFYSNLNMKDITAADYKHAKRLWKDSEIENLGDYHDLYVQSNTL